MRNLSFVVLSFVIAAGFGLDFWAWKTVHAAEAVVTQAHDPASLVPAPLSQATKQGDVAQKSNEEHLFKIQESVLKAIELSNAKTREEFDFAILAVGFVGTMVLAVFGFFGLSTALDSKALKLEAESLIKNLKGLKAKVENSHKTISDEALAVMGPKIAQIANYGMTMANFAVVNWTTLSFEDRKNSCEEAGAAIEAAGLGDELDAARSFVLARYGSALIMNGSTLEAAEKFRESCRLNTLKRPDRPYNLACAYSRLSAMAGVDIEKIKYAELALVELQNCFALASDEPVASTVSKAYFRGECATDHDLDAIRGSVRFSQITA